MSDKPKGTRPPPTGRPTLPEDYKLPNLRRLDVGALLAFAADMGIDECGLMFITGAMLANRQMPALAVIQSGNTLLRLGYEHAELRNMLVGAVEDARAARREAIARQGLADGFAAGGADPDPDPDPTHH